MIQISFFNSDATCFSQTVWPAKQYNVSKIAWRCPGGEKKGNWEVSLNRPRLPVFHCDSKQNFVSCTVRITHET